VAIGGSEQGGNACFVSFKNKTVLTNKFDSPRKKKLSRRGKSRVARLFVKQFTKLGKIHQITSKLPNGHKIYQMAIKYTKWP
jgi:hypothetical protein